MGRAKRTCSLGVAAALLVASAGWAVGQEVDRASDDPDRVVEERDRGAAATAAPVRSVTPAGALRRPKYADEGFDASAIPDFETGAGVVDEREAEQEGPLSRGIQLSWKGVTRLSAGYDSNVFRAERRETDDGLWRAQGEVELLARFPGGGELFAEVSGETLQYFEHHPANEHFVSAFAEYFQPVAFWLDAGLQNAFELSRLNLLDDNGDLFPRGRFGSLDEEVRVFAILRPPPSPADQGGLHLRAFALELGASYRLKDYEENSGVESLDYQELRFDASLSAKLSRSPRSRLKLKYRFRRRDYRECRARARDGTTALESPRLALERHQLNLTWFQELRLGGHQLQLIAGVGSVYNRDVFENDRSYRELSFSVRGEWWVWPDSTRLDLAVRGVARDFLVRSPSASSGRLRHRLLSLSAGVWQRVFGLANPDQRGDLLTVGVFVSASNSAWRSGDVNEDYDRLVLQGGLEASW